MSHDPSLEDISVRAPRADDAPPPDKGSAPDSTSTVIGEPSVPAPKNATEASTAVQSNGTAPNDTLGQLSAILAEQLLPGESATDLETLTATLFAAVKPADALEVIWTIEVVQQVWDGYRMSRLSTAYLDLCALEQLKNLYTYTAHTKIEQAWTRNQPSDRAEIQSLIEAAGFSRELLLASGLRQHIDGFERLSRIKLNHLIRRDGILREIDRRRALLAASYTGGEANAKEELEGSSDGKRS
jgi:hypothetical protein